MQNSTWDGIIRKKSTNINSINTINTMNTINTNNATTTTVHPDGVNKEEVTPAESSGLASLSASQDIPPQVLGVGIPQNWRGLKLDLFLNGYNKTDQPELKLTLGIIKLDGTTQPLRVNFNSPKDRIWNGVSDEQKSTITWQLVRELQNEFKSAKIDYRVGKALTPNKGGKTEIISFLHILPDAWKIYLIVRDNMYQYTLDKNITLTSSQKKTNMVSSLFVGKDSVQWISLDDLGI